MAKDVAISYLSIVMSFDWFRMITRECCEIYTLWDIYIYITLRWKLQAWSNVKLADYVSKFLLPLFLLKTNKVRNQEKLQKFAHVAHFGFSSQKNIFHHHHHQERKWRKCDKCWLYIIFCDCTWGGVALFFLFIVAFKSLLHLPFVASCQMSRKSTGTLPFLFLWLSFILTCNWQTLLVAFSLSLNVVSCHLILHYM